MTTLSVVNLLLYMPVRSRDDFPLLVRKKGVVDVSVCNNMLSQQLDAIPARSLRFSLPVACGQADMRDFAWTEDEVDAKQARLARAGDGGYAERPTVFCFQTAVQAILWSKVAYNFLCAAPPWLCAYACVATCAFLGAVLLSLLYYYRRDAANYCYLQRCLDPDLHSVYRPP